MNQEKIGKFIAECRKTKKLTQSELAEKLGVTDNRLVTGKMEETCQIYHCLNHYVKY